MRESCIESGLVATIFRLLPVLLLLLQDVYQFEWAALCRDNVLVESFLVGLEDVLLFYLFLQTWEDVRCRAMERSVRVWNDSRSCIVDTLQFSLAEV